MPARNKNNMDFTLLITVLILLAIGVAMVFSASSISSFMKYNDRYHYLKSQGFFAILGILAMLFMSKLDYRILGRFAGALALLSIVLLIAVFIPGIGHTANEATRWIKIGSQTMQPSEFAKFALIIFMAKSISNKKEKIRSFKHGVLPYVILAAIYFVLIILEPNLSMAGSILMITFAMLFAAGTKIIYLIGWLIPILPAVGYIIMKKPYMLARVTSYMNPWADPLNKGYQAIQSLYALGSGGIFGLGLGNSRQKFFYIPEPQNDFIFAIIGEELGFIGTSTIVILFLMLIWRGLRIALACPDTFGCLLATGITCMIAIQATLNIAVATVSIPTTGISLPFISSGGSSLLFVMVNMGILLNISKTVKTGRS
ncbi:MAG TPA: stage V sporulation protein E [Bacillota bacterium]|jgi:cell division protein FtsW|nr:stage V sporulation protein E [Bacillota bacterium]HQJ37821.1 stage V sporulation protein E [Bacillota bacterium]HQL37209.1 stage V sporulation protein E [Bacillota bacterium]HRU41937.1 stage V sporulation protein E [Candidatus Diapherotrites archaeon]